MATVTPFGSAGSGCQGHPMGLGAIGSNQGLVFKRKFRWTFRVTGICNNSYELSESFVKTAKRPNLDIEEKELHFLHGVTWIPGKAKWSELEVVYFDVNQDDTQVLYTWVSSVYNIQDPLCLNMNSKRSQYSATGWLTLFDGCGTQMETWELGHLWPKKIDFGDLDYTTSDECNITLTLRYSSVTYVSVCPTGPDTCECVGCITG